MPYSQILVRDQNLQFQVICQKMPMFEQLNDQLLKVFQDKNSGV